MADIRNIRRGDITPNKIYRMVNNEMQEIRKIYKIVNGEAVVVWDTSCDTALTVTTLADNTTVCVGFIGAASRYMVTWGDGTTTSNVWATSVTHTYADAGRYDITVTGVPVTAVTDDDDIIVNCVEFLNTYNTTARLANCSLESVIFGSKVTSIGAFSEYENLSEVTFRGDTVVFTTSYAFNRTAIEHIDLPINTTLSEYAFFSCVQLSNLTIPASVVNVPAGLCHHCTALADLQLGNGIKSIGNYAFADTAITALELPTTLETIGNSAFESCTGLADKIITIPPNVSSIGNYAFFGITRLTLRVPTGCNVGNNGSYATIIYY